MKKMILKNSLIVMLGIITFTTSSCKKDDEPEPQVEETTTLSDNDKAALLFMLEEERLARDVYVYLNSLWETPQFTNIQNSEKQHMSKVEELLKAAGVSYTILPAGQFSSTELQELYNKFKEDGKTSKLAALNIGATIEDLDIVDLQEYMDATDNSDLKNTFSSLQCASRNHLRAFVSAIEAEGGTYTPQFLTQDDYDIIIAGSHESCN